MPYIRLFVKENSISSFLFSDMLLVSLATDWNWSGGWWWFPSCPGRNERICEPTFILRVEWERQRIFTHTFIGKIIFMIKLDEKLLNRSYISFVSAVYWRTKCRRKSGKVSFLDVDDARRMLSLRFFWLNETINWPMDRYGEDYLLMNCMLCARCWDLIE